MISESLRTGDTTTTQTLVLDVCWRLRPELGFEMASRLLIGRLLIAWRSATLASRDPCAADPMNQSFHLQNTQGREDATHGQLGSMDDRIDGYRIIVHRS